MTLLPKLRINTSFSQLLYAIFVIILIPLALAFNTLYLLRSVQRDIDFELNNKALLLGQTLATLSKDKLQNSREIKSILLELTNKLEEIKAIEILLPEDDKFTTFVSTTENTKFFADPVLNQLAWGSSAVYSKQIIATLSPGKKERVWLVAVPMKDREDKKLALINLYISAAQIDAISERTTRDSLYILGGTIFIIVLLLLNHFRFFETSLLYRKLRELDQTKDDFISIASHELRAPLTAISGFAYLLMRNPIAHQDINIRRQITLIMASVERLKSLVNDMLDVSRIEQGRLQFNITYCDLKEIVISVVNEYVFQAQQKGLKLIYQSMDKHLTIKCDKDKMKQVITNLVSNAIKYTPKGEVNIYHQVQKNMVKTFFKDSGVGISQENREKLFSKFQRVYNDQTKDVPGTGLGLWITKQLVEKMGGKITVDSIENQGSQFIITFPLQP